MMPLLPPNTILELGRAYATEKPMHHQSSTQNPDGFLMQESLAPDPLFMALRHAWANNPLARLVARWRGDDEADLATDLAEMTAELPEPTLTTPSPAVRERTSRAHDLAA